ncbi:MAG: DHH family phosphoesterase [Cyclonatronaceae bacterium]
MSSYEYREAVHELVRQLRKYERVAVLSHVRPDGDAIGSQVGMCQWLEAQGITVLAHNEDADRIPDNITWIPAEAGVEISAYNSEELRTCDALLFVDGNAPARFGNKEAQAYLEQTRQPCYLVDHHPDPVEGFHVMVSIPQAASTAELVYYIYEETQTPLSPEAAAALYAGIMTDTGSFRFDSVKADLHRAVANIIEAGQLSVADIHQRVYDNREIRQLKLVGRALTHISLHGEGDWLASMYVRAKDLQETGCSYQDTEGLISFALSLNSVKAGIIFVEKEERIKMSFRSKTDFPVNKLAAKFNGGGHQKAAGGWFDGRLEEGIQAVVQEALEMKQPQG